MKTRLEQGLSALHLSPTPSGTLERYCSLLLEQNQMMNLTAITDPDQVVDLHMLDSAALLTVEDFSGKKVIDVGKRVNWLSELSAQLGAAPVECIHGRAEEQALLEGYRDCYDLAVSRAVADLRILAELCLPFVKVGGRFLAMKSDNCQEEVERAGRAIAKLGGQLRPMAQYQIPGTEITRRVVVVEKIRPTPKGYPRRFSRMKKAPL